MLLILLGDSTIGSVKYCHWGEGLLIVHWLCLGLLECYCGICIIHGSKALKIWSSFIALQPSQLQPRITETSIPSRARPPCFCVSEGVKTAENVGIFLSLAAAKEYLFLWIPSHKPINSFWIIHHSVATVVQKGTNW